MDKSGNSINISNNKASSSDDSPLLKAKNQAICILQALPFNIHINSNKEVLLSLHL